MIAYSRIGSKVWKSICSYSQTQAQALNVEEMNFLDFQISQWQKSVPAELQLPTASAPQTYVFSHVIPYPDLSAHELEVLTFMIVPILR